jgi:hypothetical protein
MFWKAAQRSAEQFLDIFRLAPPATVIIADHVVSAYGLL